MTGEAIEEPDPAVDLGGHMDAAHVHLQLRVLTTGLPRICLLVTHSARRRAPVHPLMITTARPLIAASHRTRASPRTPGARHAGPQLCAILAPRTSLVR